MGEGRERRRLARIPVHCMVVVREKLATSVVECEDVGPRGCRIVPKRPTAPGTLLQIRFVPGEGREPLEAVGQVVWSRKTPPLAAGVVFVSAPRTALHESGGSWLESLVAAQLRRVVRGDLELGELGKVQLQLGVPPRAPLDDGELAAVRIARAGGTISAVACSPEGLGPLVELLERAVVSVGRGNVDPEAWRRSLPELGAAPPAAGTAAPAVIVPPLPVPLLRERGPTR